MTNTISHARAEGSVVLCILDGWGLRSESTDNAIALAPTPNWDRMIRAWPTGELECSGCKVGLPHGQMGNSEVGHLNLGAGRIVWQVLPKINKAIDDGRLASARPLTEYIKALSASGGTCHLVGLVSPGGVHSHQDHIIALAGIVAASGIPVRIHAITDGRDTPPESAVEYLRTVEQSVSRLSDVSIATVCGRYFAMDRDTRWERVARAYDLIVSGEGDTFEDPVGAVTSAYAEDITDEYINPSRHRDYPGMKDGDGILHANFRADRVRELLAAILQPKFDGFARSRTVSLKAALGMVAYSDQLNQLCEAIFPPVPIANTLGEVVANAGLRQLRAAETEKYAHVTYFFNGGIETPFAGEDRILVPSPQVATYDLQPEMSAPELTTRLVDAIETGSYDLIVINYANGDMVGHTGDLQAAMKAVACVDDCIGQLERAVIEAGGALLVVSDHGNCEMMFDREAGVPHTAHTLNPVPIVLINTKRSPATINDGCLADVAPTVLELMGVALPQDMSGHSLID